MFKALAALSRSLALVDLDRRSLATVAVASVLINLLMFALPLYSLQVYDRVLSSRSVDTLWLLSLIVALALGVAALVDVLRARILLRVGNGLALALGPRLMETAISRSARLAEPDGQLLRDVQTVRGFVGAPQGLVALIDAPLVPLYLIAVYAMHVGLGHAMLFGIVCLLGLALLTEVRTGGVLREAGEAGIRAQRRVDGVMLNAEVVEAMGMRAAMRRVWLQAQAEAMSLASAAGDRAAHLAGLAKAVRLLLNLLLTGGGAWYAIHDEITVGAMVAVGILSARGLAPLESLIGAWKGLVASRSALQRIDLALADAPRAESAMSLPAPAGRLVLERVGYQPPGAVQPTIKGVDMVLEPGTWLGLIGPSAAGKSTLAKLICGVWRPQAGSVRLDGAEVFGCKRSEFGRHCGYLPQDVELFAGSVRDNIARFDATDDAEVVAAAQLAGCHEMILRLPQAYDTVIGAGGASLSGGQRQRIGLARAVLRRPRLVVLDEPNASLDNEGEAALLAALAQLREGGSTIVMISHRPSALAGADTLAVLVDGRLQQFGARDEVLARMQGLVPAPTPAAPPRTNLGGIRRVGV